MSKKIDIENKVKESFKAAESSAPSGIWEGISNKLDDSASNSALDSRVKESFEGSISRAPDKNRQLNIDSVWKRTLSSLIRISLWRRLRRVAALLLLLLFGWGAYRNYEDQFLVESENSQPALLEEVRTKGGEMDKSTDQISNEPAGGLAVAETRMDSDETHANKAFNSLGTAEQATATSQSTLSNEDIYHGVVTASTYRVLEVKSDEVSPGLTDDGTTESIVDEDKTPVSKLSKMISLNLPGPSLILLSPEMLKDSANSSIHNIKNRIAIGFTYSHNNTWILNNETSDAFDPNSLVTYGLEGTVRVTATQSIAAQFYINSRVKQDYGLYLEGKHTSKKVRVDYVKFGLMYKMSCPQINTGKNAICAVQLGPYVSRLKNQSVYHDDKIVAIESDYQDLDWGVKVAVGQDVQIDRYILSYGLNGEYGLVNIFAGQGRISPKFDITKNAHIGVYLSAKYRF